MTAHPVLAALSRLARGAPRARSTRAVVVALACSLFALWSAPARAHVESHVLTARLTMPSVAHREDSRLGLWPTFAYYTRRDADASPRLASGNPRLRLRLAKDPLLLTIDEYRYHSRRTTLWGWPGQNPLRYRDPSGHGELGAAIGLGIGGLLGAQAGFVLGGGVGLVGLAGGPTAAVTVPTGAIAGATAGYLGGALAGAYWGNRIGDALSGLHSTSGNDDEPPESGVRPRPDAKPWLGPDVTPKDKPWSPDQSGETTREQRCMVEAQRLVDEMEGKGCHTEDELNKAFLDAFRACMAGVGD